jgi:hypothetical protein
MWKFVHVTDTHFILRGNLPYDLKSKARNIQ